MKDLVSRISVAAVLTAMSATVAGADWFETTKIKGDLRYRYERTDKEGSAVRDLHRIRVRCGVAATVNSDVTAEVRVATGSGAPASRDQTLGDGFTTKDISLDRACFDWQPLPAKEAHVVGGKMANPFVGSRALVWDSDVTPEGLALKCATGDESAKLIFNAGAFCVEERSSLSDAMLYGAQIAGDVKTDRMSMLAGFGVYLFENMKGRTVLVGDTDSYGNSTDIVTNSAGQMVELTYANEFNQIEGFLEIGTSLGSLPCKVCAQYVVNTEADANDTGYLLGFQLGKASKPGSLQLDYDWRKLEADAVVGALTDSNVWGGGTDGQGHRVYLAMQLGDRWTAGLEYFLSEAGLENGKDYEKLRLELKAAF